MDEILGLLYLRVPTWCPFRLQFYGNGHSRLARSLTKAGIDYAMADNAFIRIDDWERAQQLADAFSPDTLHALLDRYAEQCCPIATTVAACLRATPTFRTCAPPPTTSQSSATADSAVTGYERQFRQFVLRTATSRSRSPRPSRRGTVRVARSSRSDPPRE